MINPNQAVFRICPSCSAPSPLHQQECPGCGHSFLSQPAETEVDHIFRGNVFFRGRWMTIAEKIKLEQSIELQLASGKVEHEGGWVSIEEKARKIRQDRSDRGNVVDFPVKQGDLSTFKAEAVEEPADDSAQKPAPVHHGISRTKKWVLVLLCAVTFLTIATAVGGIFLRKWIPLFF